MKPETKVYQGILAMITGFVVLFLIFNKPWLIYLASSIGIVSVFSEKAAGFIYKYWMKLAQILGTINSKILLTIIFYLFLTPLSFIYRLLNKDTLQLKKDSSKTTYFITRNHTYTKADLEKMW